ncbi:MAG: hypothetical protein O6949_00850, partial [Chloroflexi bacterium]|nr:hypothetical protein [Chloroflexota bacterium]
MGLVLGADDHRVMGNKLQFTLLAAIAVCVPDAQREEGVALLVYRIRRQGNRREPRSTHSFQLEASEL